MGTIVQLQEPIKEPNVLRCTSCGATTQAPCECGVPFALLKPSEAARIALQRTPELSNRIIAEYLGINPSTVDEMRKQLPVKPADDKRKGKDGRVRRPPTTSPVVLGYQMPPKPKRGCDPVLTKDLSVNEALVAVFDFIVTKGWSDYQLALFVHACQKLHQRAKGSQQWYDAVQRRRAAKREAKRNRER